MGRVSSIVKANKEIQSFKLWSDVLQHQTLSCVWKILGSHSSEVKFSAV